MMNVIVAGGHAVLGIWLWRRQNERRFMLRDETSDQQLNSSPQGNIHLDTIRSLSTCLPNLNSTPILPEPLDSTPCSFIDDPLELSAVAARLASATRLALDIEHHSLHTYYGKSCLIQLSDGCEDFVIDAIALKPIIPSTLGPIFSDPQILKVVHGGGSDALWLLRDFGIRLLNVFDTEKCCQVLGYPPENRSYKFLLNKFVDVDVDKSLQMADWRQRPLAKELMEYARSDVHFLLYIADCLGKELGHGGGKKDKDKNKQIDPESLLGRAVHRSQALSLVEYSPTLPRVAASAAAAGIMKHYIAALRNSSKENSNTRDTTNGAVVVGSGIVFDEAQIARITDFSVRVHSLCVWRDSAARKIDEGVTCVLPDDVLLSIAQQHYENNLKGLEDLERLLLIEKSNLTKKKDLCKFPEVALLANNTAAILKELNAAGAGKRPWAHPDVLAAMKPPSTTLYTAAKRRHEDPEVFKERLGERFGVKKQVYENCRMLSKCGEMLCFTDKKRLLWYVRKGLAVEVEPGKEPLTVQLTFEHRADDQLSGAHEFYSSKRSNTCVACGTGKHYLRYRVVPVCYRRALPERFKSHRSHDVLLLCVGCHEVAQRASEQMKREISNEYGVPLFPHLTIAATTTTTTTTTTANGSGSVNGGGGGATDTDTMNSNSIDGKEEESLISSKNAVTTTTHKKSKNQPNPEGLHPFSVRKAAIALEGVAALPDHRREELQTIVATYVRTVEPWLKDTPVDAPFSQHDLWAGLLAGMSKTTRRKVIRKWVSEGNEEQLPQALLQELQKSGTEGCNTGVDIRDGMGHSWHGQQVIAVAHEQGGDEALSALCSRFRQAFIDALNPQYLPSGWKVDHTAPRTFGEHSIFNEEDDDEGEEEGEEEGVNGHSNGGNSSELLPEIL